MSDEKQPRKLTVFWAATIYCPECGFEMKKSKEYIFCGTPRCKLQAAHWQLPTMELTEEL